jgi:MYXO-CTERM domain-containing protein
MRRMYLLAACVAMLAASDAFSGVIVTPGGYAGVTTDDFDVSRGTTVLSSSTIIARSDARSALGFLNGGPEPTNTIFADNAPAGTVDSLVFRTPSAITLRDLKVGFADDSNSGQANRGTTLFKLLASTDGVNYSSIVSAPILSNYVSSYRDSVITLTVTNLSVANVRFFRVETTRATSLGTRIVEIDANVSVVPEPSSLTFAALGLTSLAGYSAWRRRRRHRAT